jgi:hypothetical protein
MARQRERCRAITSGQGEIRTHDTGFTGMPVFETGAFSHSATCPTILRRTELERVKVRARRFCQRATARGINATLASV